MLEIQIIGVVIAALSALVSVYYSQKARREAESQSKETKAHRLVQIAQIDQEYRSQLREWARRVIFAMVEARILLEDSQNLSLPLHEEKNRTIRTKLSALTDEGRWFFANEGKELYGEHKLPAFRGFRPSVLDAPVDVYHALREVEGTLSTNGDNNESRIKKNIKGFVNEIAKVVGPERMQEDINRLKDGL